MGKIKSSDYSESYISLFLSMRYMPYMHKQNKKEACCSVEDMRALFGRNIL